ncbi:MAG: class I SAM-dependent methyltransferase [Verrucomicrobiae bacterium]|nr:class I SAM-dependent methyltransferase [Verrucomicrobiae bacterium]
MIIHPESHLERVGEYLRDLRVLEVGCGDGFRSKQLVGFCRELVGIDPNAAAVAEACARHGDERIEYLVATAESLPFPAASFGSVVFVLSLHHIPVHQMASAIDEAIRVAVPDAPIIFIEPGFRGLFFEMDEKIGVCDGDERLQKAQAYAAILSHPGLQEVEEFWDTTRYSFTSTEDFADEFELLPRQFAAADAFLTVVGHELDGERRINVCRKR